MAPRSDEQRVDLLGRRPGERRQIARGGAVQLAEDDPEGGGGLSRLASRVEREVLAVFDTQTPNAVGGFVGLDKSVGVT